MKTLHLGVALGGLCVWAAATAVAADRTWDGGGSDANWKTPANWDGDATYPSAGDALVFGGAAGLANTNDLDAGTSIAGLTFSSGAGAFLLSGNAVTLGGDLVNNDADTQTVALPLILDGPRTVNAASGDLQLAGPVSGSGGLTKTGSKTLTLSSANTYEGETVVNAGGRLLITHGQALGSPSAGTTIATGTGIEIHGGLSVAEPITLVNQNSGSMNFMSGSNLYSGLITITGGQARISNQAPFTHITGGITSFNSTVILDTGNGAADSALRISGQPILASGQKCFVHGARTAVFGVAGHVFSPLEVSGGTLRLEVPNAWPASLSLEVGVSYSRNSHIDLQGNDQTVGTLTGVITNDGVRTITSSTGPATLTVNQGGTTEYNSNFSGALRLVKLGAGQLTVSGTNCLQTGQTVIGGGKLRILSEKTLGLAPAEFAADHLVISNGATLLAVGPCVLDDATRGITMGVGNGTFETAAGADMTVSNRVTGAGGLTKAGAGVLTLCGVNDYAGVTTVSAGILQAGQKSALYNGSPLSADKFTVNSGAILSLNVGGPGEFSSSDVSAIASLGTATTGFKPGSWLALNTTNAADGLFEVSDTLGNPSGGHALNLQKLGLGTLALTGMNTYTGATKISQGVLSVNSLTNGGLPSALGQATSHRSNLVFDGGVLRYTGPSTRTDKGFTYAVATNVYAFDVTQAGTVLTFGAVTNVVADSANTTLMKTGPGTLVLAKGSGGGYNLALKAIHIWSGSLLTEAGSTIQQNVHALASQGPALLFGDGAVLGYNAPMENYVNGAEMILSYVGTQSCARITSGQLTLCGPTNTATATQSNTHIFDINDGADDVDLDLFSELNIYTGNANSHLRKTGAGTLRLRSSLNAYNGVTTIRNGRVLVTANVPASGKSVLGNSTSALQLGDAGTQPDDVPTFAFEGPANSAFTFARGIVTFATGGASAVGSASNVNVTLSGPITASNTLQLVSVAGGTNALFITGGIAGPGGAALTGTGTVWFVAANSYTGTTTLAAGTLRLAASERIADASPLRLVNGTLLLNGLSETAGSLDVDGAAVIDFGGGACTLTCADSASQTWEGQLLLRNLRLGGANHLFIGSSASLSQAQLAKIVSPTGQVARQLPSGEVILLPLGTMLKIL